MKITPHTRRANALSLSALTLALLSLLPLPAQAIDFNLNKVFDVVKGVSKSIDAGTMSEADEISVGRGVAERTLGTYPVVKDEAVQHYVNVVGRWVAMQSERPALPWRFAVVQADQVNAFAIPGGVILVTSGMMKLVGNEGELACVIGHEVGHVVRKHHLALLQKGALIDTGAQLAADSFQAGSAKGMAKQFLVKEGAELFTRSLDRGAERDADADGVLLAARAGYDPASCLSVMKRMAARRVEDGSLAALYKTHPQAADRLVDVDAALGMLDGAAAGQGQTPKLPKR
jgi:beta-barrel assembly-enhancing protease